MRSGGPDAGDWTIAPGIADPARVAIMGGSYGGYSALVGLTPTPEKFACAVDLVGISNLVTFLNPIPENRRSFKAVEAFLAAHLDGCVEPVGGDYAGSTIEFRAGRELIPGLD
ncbi:MAG TPA: prolyl oligopeptidase family serine peptidase [Stellaceae bacterium]|nr:prolyl oligopeptidase family serine peptidase [Stellaceae bacterium]